MNVDFSSKFESKKSMSFEFQRFNKRFAEVNCSRIVSDDDVETWDDMIAVAAAMFAAIVTLSIFCRSCLIIRFILRISSFAVSFLVLKSLLRLMNRWATLSSFSLISGLFLNFLWVRAPFLYRREKYFKERSIVYETSFLRLKTSWQEKKKVTTRIVDRNRRSEVSLECFVIWKQ